MIHSSQIGECCRTTHRLTTLTFRIVLAVRMRAIRKRLKSCQQSGELPLVAMARARIHELSMLGKVIGRPTAKASVADQPRIIIPS